MGELMLEEGQILYTKRYPHGEGIGQMEGSAHHATGMRETEKALERFKQRLKMECVYIPLPGQQRNGERFIALAKGLSQRYEIDIDIKKKRYLLEVSLHLYCAAYPADMTHRLSELLSLCDRSHVMIHAFETSDYTLMLDLYTHKRCILEES